MPSAKKKRWSWSTGERGVNRVRVYEDPARGVIFAEFYERIAGEHHPKRQRISLGHADRDRAKQRAEEMAAQFRLMEPQRPREMTLGALFDNYLREVTPSKGSFKQQHDHRCAEMFRRYFGDRRKPLTLAKRDFDRYVADRRSGAVAPAHVEKRRAVGPTVIGHDLRFLNAVFNWATIAGDGNGGVLLERNPFKGFALPQEESPRRPMVSEQQYQSLRSVARRVHPLFELALVIAHETGHRGGSIRMLQWSDVDLEHGRLKWRREHDKIGFEHETLLTPDAKRVLEMARKESPAIGDAWLFPAPRDARKPIPRYTLIKWWKAAERLAKLRPAKGRGYHSLRRKFATELKKAPLRDLAYLGGWKSPETVVRVYQKPDDETMREALEQRTRLRELERTG